MFTIAIQRIKIHRMYNLIAYFIYLLISIFITIFVGYKCYKTGEIYLLFIIKDTRTCNAINRILLVSYYLVNMGYIAISISNWDVVNSFLKTLEILISKISTILIVLSFLHYSNLFLIYKLRKQLILNFKS